MQIKRTSHTVQVSKNSSWKSVDSNWYTHCWCNQLSFESESKHFEKEKHFTSPLWFSCLLFALWTWKSYIHIVWGFSIVYSMHAALKHPCTWVHMMLCLILSRAPTNQNANIQILKQIKSVTEKEKRKKERERESFISIQKSDIAVVTVRNIFEKLQFKEFSGFCCVVLRCVLLCLILCVCKRIAIAQICAYVCIVKSEQMEFRYALINWRVKESAHI